VPLARHAVLEPDAHDGRGGGVVFFRALRRCQNHGLTRPPSDCDLLTDVRWLKLDLWDFFDWTCSDADYLFMFSPHDDVEELEQFGWWRKAFLARYGRQNMLQWDDVPVSKMNRLLHELIQILKKENELTRMQD
jgi:hypothetical protein